MLIKPLIVSSKRVFIENFLRKLDSLNIIESIKVINEDDINKLINQF